MKPCFAFITRSEKAGFWRRGYKEFEEKETPEAELVRQLDKLEMGLQAWEYEHSQKINLESFFVNTRLLIKDPHLNKILKEIEKLRKVSFQTAFAK